MRPLEHARTTVVAVVGYHALAGGNASFDVEVGEGTKVVKVFADRDQGGRLVVPH